MPADLLPPIGTTKIVRRSSDAAARNSGNTGSTLADDDTLLFAVGVSEVWHVEAWLLISSANVTMDAKIGWSIPNGASISWGAISHTSLVGGFDGTAVGNTQGAILTSSGAIALGSANNGTFGFHCAGIVAIGATAGNVALQWAQQTSDPGDLKILTNSFLLVRRLA